MKPCPTPSARIEESLHLASLILCGCEDSGESSR
jgi:hypothetical protein